MLKEIKINGNYNKSIEFEQCAKMAHTEDVRREA